MSAPSHRGVATEDPRNAGVIEIFRPEDLTPEALRRRIEEIAARVDRPETKAKILERAEDVGTQTFRPPPPLLEAPGEFEWKDMAYAAHPDLVTAIRGVNAGLKKSPSGVRTAKTDIALVGERLKAARTHYELHYATGAKAKGSRHGR